MTIVDDFQNGMNPYWRITQIGASTVTALPGALDLTVNPTSAEAYADAQISDYKTTNFKWKPPLRMTVRAYSPQPASQLRGTAGFGFWNQPFMPGQVRLRLPQAAWFFFSSPPSNMKLARDVPGPGWKAATINTRRWQFLTLAPTAPIAVFLMRIPLLYRLLWPIGQRAIGVSEHLLPADVLNERHTYTLEWQPDTVIFSVDGAVIQRTPSAPAGPLGFVTWIDNQYAIVTPQGQFGFGLLPVEQTQSLILEYVSIESL